MPPYITFNLAMHTYKSLCITVEALTGFLINYNEQIK